MENPIPVQPVESIPETPRKKNYPALSIFAGILFGLFWFPAIFLGAALSLILLLLAFGYLHYFPQLTNMSVTALFWPVLILAAIPSTIVGILNGRRVYARSNQAGSTRHAGFGMLLGPGIGLAGFLCFPVVCYAGYLVASVSASDSGGLAPLLPLAMEPELQIFGEVVILIPCAAILLAYLAAGLTGWIAHRRLDDRSG